MYTVQSCRPVPHTEKSRSLRQSPVSYAALLKEFRQKIFCLFPGRAGTGIGNTVYISRQVHLPLLHAEPVHMEIRPLDHEHSLLCFKQDLIQVKGQDIEDACHHACFSVIYHKFVRFCNALFFHPYSLPLCF